MYSLSLPTRNGLDDFDAISNRRNIATRNLLNQIRSNVTTAYNAYWNCHGKGSQLTPINVSMDTAEALKSNFRLLDRNNSYASMRDEISGTVRYGCCPYCNLSHVDSLDHVLPRSFYPEYSVLAENLVPSCSRCNEKKSDECYQSTGKNLMHPYFVDIPDSPILWAEIDVNRTAVTVHFELRINQDIDADMFDSIANLFVLLDLAELYSVQAIGEMKDRVGHMNTVFLSCGAIGLRNFLASEANSTCNNRGENYWKTALLRALARSREFCKGGYRLLL